MTTNSPGKPVSEPSQPPLEWFTAHRTSERGIRRVSLNRTFTDILQRAGAEKTWAHWSHYANNADARDSEARTKFIRQRMEALTPAIKSATGFAPDVIWDTVVRLEAKYKGLDTAEEIQVELDEEETGSAEESSYARFRREQER